MPLSDDVLRQRLSTQEWTAHNIRLTEDLSTLPSLPDFMATDLRLHAILRVMSLLYRDEYTGLRIADLGCLEGGFALALAQRGGAVLGVEARARNLGKCLLLKEHFSLPNLDFVEADVKDFRRDVFGEFDVVLALGILYHLSEPAAWLRQIAEATRAVLIVDSHYAPSDDAALAKLDPRIAHLGAIERIAVDGWTYEGRWFEEYQTEAQRDAMLWASYSNPRSFWLTKESLLTGLVRSGFDLVLEQHDYSVPSYKFLTEGYPRGLFIAIKIDGCVHGRSQETGDA